MTILLLETIHPAAHGLLESHEPVVVTGAATEAAKVVDSQPVRAILTRGKGRITRELMTRAPSLLVIARCGVGLDNLDTVAARELGIPVVYSPGSNTGTVAEHTLMLMLAAARRVGPLERAIKAGNWAIRDSYEGSELQGKTLGIVGLGAIGRRVAVLAEAFGMKVVYWNRTTRAERWTALPLGQLLAEADVVSLHLALNAGTRHLIGATELASMKPNAILVNTARGAILDQQALAATLEHGRLAGFAADVLDEEPPAQWEPWLQNERVTLTPHIASLTDVTYRQVCLRTARNVLAILRGEPADQQSIYQPKK